MTREISFSVLRRLLPLDDFYCALTAFSHFSFPLSLRPSGRPSLRPSFRQAAFFPAADFISASKEGLRLTQFEQKGLP